MEPEVFIGLEIHVEMKTKSKMFSSAPVSFGKEPNTKVDIVDFAFPGTMPTVNKQAVINAIRVSNALHMDIDHVLMFDRKNYFYSDLPKGYQITQQFRPIGSNGYLVIDVDGEEKRIGIERLHIEEDTCKQIHSYDFTYLDYNRAGIPLIEIVSYPVMRSGKEAAKYVEKIRSIVSFLDVSDGKMEEGSLRCDVNVSIREKGKDKLGTKVEIKNLNSLMNIQKAVDFEIFRQSRLLEEGTKIEQETRRFDEDTSKTVLMRVKSDEVDYKFFVEPNIPPILLSDEFIKSAIETSPELAEERMSRYKELGLNEYDCSQLLSSKEISDYFDEAIKSGASPKLIANWVIRDVQSYINKNNIPIKEFGIVPLQLGKLVLLVEEKYISIRQAKEIFDKIIRTGQNPEVLIQELAMTQLNDEGTLIEIINELLDENPDLVTDYKNGKDKVLDFLVGQIMKKTQGKANPNVTSKLLIQEIKRR